MIVQGTLFSKFIKSLFTLKMV